jgi:hypothetical protein
MAAGQGFHLPHYAVCLDNGQLYRWAPDDATTANGYTVVAATGGTSGNWLHVPGDTLGADLTDADETLTVAQKFVRYVEAATLTANRTKTLSTTGAINGHVITIVRLDTTAFTMPIVNGGAGAGTIITFPVSVRYWADFRFDGTNWRLLRAGQMAA